MAGLFDPSMFPNAMNSGAPQMGLLARLQQMINQPTGQAPGFPPQPGSDAMAQGLIPPQAMQAPQSAPPMSPPMQQAPQGGGFMDALSGFLGNHQNALLGLGAGIASGGLQRGVPGLAAGAQQDYTQNIQRSTMAATYQSLLSAGLPAPIAQAATLNPEILKTVAPTLYQKPTLQETRQNPLTGQKEFSVWDPNAQSLKPVAGGAPQGPQDQGPNYDPETRRDEAYLATLDPTTAAAVKAAVNGDLSGTGKTLNQVMPLAARYEDGFNQNTYTQRGQALHDFYGGGKSQQTVKNLNQFVGHLGMLPNLVDQQGNMGGLATPLNAPWNATKSAFGATGQNPVKTTAHAAADELAAFFKGQGISDTEIKQWKDSFRENGSPAQQREDISTLMSLADHGLDAMEKKRADGLGPVLSAKMPPIVSPQTQGTIDAIRSWSQGGKAAAPAGSPAGAKLPPQAAAQLKEGIHTKFGNGQVWTLQNGQPAQVQ